MASDSQICDECVYRVDVAWNKHAEGVILCKKCDHTKNFRFYSTSGGSMVFNNVGLNSDDETIYIPARTSARVTSELWKLKAIQCMGCDSPVPTWFLKHNKYVQQYFKE